MIRDRFHLRRLPRPRRARPLAAALASGVILAAVPAAGAATAHGADSGGATNLQAKALAYSRCMRAHGVTKFPDPSPGGGWNIQPGSGVDPLSPLYRRANAKCQKLLPGGGAGPAYNPKAGPQLLRIAACMRHHGFPQFPDPARAPANGSLSSIPRRPGVGMITDYQGWLLEFPATIDMQSPAFTRALAACHAGFLTGQH